MHTEEINVLGIIGSPRKGGNTAILVDTVLGTIREMGGTTNVVYLSDICLRPCDGCSRCTELKKCWIHDDAEKIYQAMAKSDGILIGSPVYCGSITAQLKIFLDRIAQLHRVRGRTAFMNKVGAAVVVGSREGLLSAYSQIVLFLLMHRMMIPGSRWVLGRGHKIGDVMEDNEAKERAKELGSAMIKLIELTGPLRNLSAAT